MNNNRYIRVSPIRGTLNTHIRNQEVTKDDIFDRLVSLPKPAQKLFTRIKSTYDYKYNTAYITRDESELDGKRGPYKTLRNQIKMLEKVEILLEVKERCFFRDLNIQESKDYIFLINPYFILPVKEEIVWRVWDELCVKRGLEQPTTTPLTFANNQR